MPQLDGNEYRLRIESTTPGTYNEIAGQQGLTKSGSTNLIDVSTKASGAYALQRVGKRNVTITCEGLADLPDANGYTRLETRANQAIQAPTMFRIVKLPSTVVFEASMYIGNFEGEFPQDGNVPYSFTLTLAAAPVTDTLS
jgi:predicted secreted protein